MSRDSVRYGRVPKRPREVANSNENMPDLHHGLNVPGMAGPSGEMQSEQVRSGVAKELLKMILSAHQANNTYTDELRYNIQRQIIVLNVEEEGQLDEAAGGMIVEEQAASSTTETIPEIKPMLWYNLSLRMTPTVQHVVEFAKRLPGFHNLPQDDQLILVKVGFFEVWLSRVSTLSTPDYLVLDDGSTLTLQHLETMYDASFAQAVLSYVRTMINLSCSEDEMAVYTGALLMWPHRPGISQFTHITTMHRAITDALKHAVVSRGVSDPAGRLEAFTAAAVEVRTLGHRHHELLGWCRKNWSHLVLPALFAEIFDIPKGDDPPAFPAATEEPTPSTSGQTAPQP
ncbi:hypothetical protein ACJJTC_000584 [Scirpophaga incertulas]